MFYFIFRYVPLLTDRIAVNAILPIGTIYTVWIDLNNLICTASWLIS